MATQIDQVATQIDQVATQIDQVATQIDQVATLFDVLAPQIVAIIREISRKGLVGGLVRPYFDDLYVDYKARNENNWKKKEKKKKRKRKEKEMETSSLFFLLAKKIKMVCEP